MERGRAECVVGATAESRIGGRERTGGRAVAHAAPGGSRADSGRLSRNGCWRWSWWRRGDACMPQPYGAFGGASEMVHSRVAGLPDPRIRTFPDSHILTFSRFPILTFCRSRILALWHSHIRALARPQGTPPDTRESMPSRSHTRAPESRGGGEAERGDRRGARRPPAREWGLKSQGGWGAPVCL
jgi:hypothetical protein